MQYKHTQFGREIIITLLVAGSWFVYLFKHSGVGDLTEGVVPTLVSLMLVGVVFGSLTVELNKEYLKWKYGIGIIRKKILLRDIESIKIVHNKWYWGWGIRRYSGGRLYNISGLNAIEITLHNSDKKIRLGTDEPEKLIRVININLKSSYGG